MQHVFQPGQPFEDAITSEYLNSIESRFATLMNPQVSSDLGSGFAGALQILLGFVRKHLLIGRLTEDLLENETAEAKVRKWTANGGHEDDDDIPNKVVRDVFGTRSCQNEIGLIFEHPEATDQIWLWIPFPVRPGTAIKGYDSTKRQVLTHDAQGCLEWISTTTC